MRFFKKNFLLCFLLGLCLLTACTQDPLYQDLTERDANEILVVLYHNGVDASKKRIEKGQEFSYIISVPRGQLQQARQILVTNNLPHEKQLGFSGICQEKGLIPTPEEEKCRKLLALKGEIINSLEKIPGVIQADVVLNIPIASEFSTDGVEKKPTASAILRMRKDSEGESVTESRIQRFISNTVENLDPRDVSVIVSYSESPEKILAGGPLSPTSMASTEAAGKIGNVGIAGLSMHEGSLKRFKIYATCMLVLLLGVSAALIVNVIKLTRMRQELKVSKAQAGLSELPSGETPPLLADGASNSTPQEETPARNSQKV